jgi:hypothetical protein
MIPFGTVTVEETKAPTGYLLPQPGDSNYKVFLTRYVPDPAAPNGVRIEGDGNGVIQANAPLQKEQVIRGDIELTKHLNLYKADTVEPTGVIAPEPDAIFDFYASRDFSGTTPQDGAQPAFSLTTDANGFASTVTSDCYLIQNQDGSYTVKQRPSGIAGGLPYDSYLCVQRTSDPAYEKCENFIYTITDNGQVVSREAYDSVIPAAIQIVKLDSETGQQIAYPATWQIYSLQTSSYLTMHDGAEITDTFISDNQGNLVLPEQLPFGDYLLHEVKAPYNQNTGYLLNPTDVPFSVTERHDFDSPLIVEMGDLSVKARIGISKEGKRGKQPVEGAEYAVIAEGDIVTLDGTVHASDGETVTTMTTGADGKVQSDLLYLGSYRVEELTAPDGYLRDEKEYKVNLVYQDQTTELVQEHLDLIDTEVVIEANKLDKSTDEPVADTEFTLYRETAPGSDEWVEIRTLTTDTDGKASFYPVIKGSYKLVETRPNPEYASNEESGEDCARYITIDENSTEEVQVFHDKRIQLSCETYKDTINITSAGFKTFDDDYLQIKNVGSEQYHYTLDFRSTSNVRADEFTVVDPLTEVFTGNVRLQELFTPATQGDTDGYFNLWYRTNFTDTAQLYSSANAMTTNPYNPNNPKNSQKWSSVGWQLWQQDIPATNTIRLSVADLGLAPDEHITALRYEYGSVEVGFTTRATAKQALQQTKELKSTFSDWTETPVADEGSFTPSSVVNLEPATYLVDCSTALMPPTLIKGTASVNIARNVVLSDDDRDTVQTTVIEPFMMLAEYIPPTDISKLEGFTVPRAGGLPATGDSKSSLGMFFALFLLLATVTLVYNQNPRTRKG